MPSPVGHALGGLIVGLLVAPGTGILAPGTGNREPGTGSGVESGESGLGAYAPLLVVVGVSVAPDIDFLWGRHNMETHSLGAAVAAGLVMAAWTRGRTPRLALAVALAWASHVLFDWLGSDTTPPLGVMALWPITSTFYFADAFLFEAISRRTLLPNFWSHNLWAVGKEVLMLAPLAGAAWALRRRQLSD